MKPNLFSTSIALLLVGAISANAAIDRLEYYINTDPGMGNGRALSVTSANDFTQAFVLDLDNLTGVPSGTNTLYIRAHDDVSDTWGLALPHTFVLEPSSGNADNWNVATIEYFLNSPGDVGTGTDVPLPTTAPIVNLSTALSAGTVNLGGGELYIRAQDANGWWGPLMRRKFNIDPQNAGNPAPDITRIEVNAEGSLVASNIATQTGANFVDDTIVPLNTYTIGTSLDLSYTAIDENGNAGLPNYRRIVLDNSSNDELANIVGYRYEIFDSTDTLVTSNTVDVSTPAPISDETLLIDIGLPLIRGDEYTMRVIPIDSYGVEGYRDGTNFTVQHIYADFVADNFDSEAPDFASISHYQADPDEDGIPNIIEWLRNTNPLTANPIASYYSPVIVEDTEGKKLGLAINWYNLADFDQISVLTDFRTDLASPTGRFVNNNIANEATENQLFSRRIFKSPTDLESLENISGYFVDAELSITE